MMSHNAQTAEEVAFNGIKNRLPGWTTEMLAQQASLMCLVKDIVEGVYEGERKDLRDLKAYVRSLICNVPHSCVSDEHCCAIHEAMNMASRQVEASIQKLIDAIGKGG